MRAWGVGTLVVGLGNGHRGDDAAGLRVAELVRARAPNLRVLAIEGDPSVLIEAWAGVGLTIVIDAIEGAHPGRVHRIEPEHERVIGRLPGGHKSRPDKALGRRRRAGCRAGPTAGRGCRPAPLPGSPPGWRRYSAISQNLFSSRP